MYIFIFYINGMSLQKLIIPILKSHINDAMNSTIISSKKRAYHTVANAEFTGFYYRIVLEHQNTAGMIGTVFVYHFFIKYGDKVYMEVKGIGDVVISFDELQKNKYWKHYYDLSLLLVNDKHSLVQELTNNSDYGNHRIYDEPRFWSIDTAFIEFSMKTKTNKVNNYEETGTCYYKINPFDLEIMGFTSKEDLDIFQRIYMTRTEFRNRVFEKRAVIYNLVIEYQINKMEMELGEISVFFEDKKNLVMLVALKDKIKNEDILSIIYENLVSYRGKAIYNPNMVYAGNSMELVAQIMSI